MRESRENMTPPAMRRLMIVVFMQPLIIGMLTLRMIMLVRDEKNQLHYCCHHDSQEYHIW